MHHLPAGTVVRTLDGGLWRVIPATTVEPVSPDAPVLPADESDTPQRETLADACVYSLAVLQVVAVLGTLVFARDTSIVLLASLVLIVTAGAQAALMKWVSDHE